MDNMDETQLISIVVPVKEWNELVRKVTEIHQFCAAVADTMDKLKDNPMLKAMLPPGF